MIKICLECKKEFKAWRKTSTYCSRICLWKNNGGHNKKPESWWINQRGYIEGRIWLPDGTQIQVKKHRFIMEGILGRPLLSSEDVHHIDGNKQNNEPSNLILIDHGEHSKLTNKSRTYKKGYKLNLSAAERKSRSFRAIARQLNQLGKKAKSEGR